MIGVCYMHLLVVLVRLSVVPMVLAAELVSVLSERLVLYCRSCDKVSSAAV